MNGFRLKVAADPAEQFLIEDVIVKKVSLEVTAEWLEKHMTPVNRA